MADTNELVERLSAAVGMILEENCPAALTSMPPASEDVDAKLAGLDQACKDAATLVQAAQVLARRGIR